MNKQIIVLDVTEIQTIQIHKLAYLHNLNYGDFEEVKIFGRDYFFLNISNGDFDEIINDLEKHAFSFLILPHKEVTDIKQSFAQIEHKQLIFKG